MMKDLRVTKPPYSNIEVESLSLSSLPCTTLEGEVEEECGSEERSSDEGGTT